MSADSSPESNSNERPRRRDNGDASSDEELAQLNRSMAAGAEAQSTVVRTRRK